MHARRGDAAQLSDPWMPGAGGPLVSALLDCAAGTAAEIRHPALAANPQPADERQLRWVLDAGLGPLLRHFLPRDAAAVPDAIRELLQGSDLTGRVRHAGLEVAPLQQLAY